MVKIRNKHTRQCGILSDALAVSFDNHIGHDYIENAQNDLNGIILKRKDISLIYHTSTKLPKVLFLKL